MSPLYRAVTIDRLTFRPAGGERPDNVDVVYRDEHVATLDAQDIDALIETLEEARRS